MVKIACVSRARPSGTSVFGRPAENRHDKGSVLMRFRGAVSGAVEAVGDARWQVLGHVGRRSWAHGGRSRSATS